MENIIKPNFVVIKLDETRNWSEYIQQRAKKRIFGYYLVDLSIITHLCEITGSYWCEFLYNRFEDTSSFEDENGELTDELTDELTLFEMEGESMYIPENTNLNIVAKYDYPYDGEDEEDYENFIERIIDHYKSNPVE